MPKYFTIKTYKNPLTFFTLYILLGSSVQLLCTSEAKRYMMLSSTSDNFSSLTATKLNGMYTRVKHQKSSRVEKQSKNIVDDGSIIPIISSTDEIGHVDTMCVCVQHQGKEEIMKLSSVKQIGFDVYENKPNLYCDSCQRSLFSDEQCYSYDYIDFVEANMQTHDLCLNCVSHLLAKLWEANKDHLLKVLSLFIYKNPAKIIYEFARPRSLPIKLTKKAPMFCIRGMDSKKSTSFVLNKTNTFSRSISYVDGETLRQIHRHLMRKNNDLGQRNNDLQERNTHLGQRNNDLQERNTHLEQRNKSLGIEITSLKEDIAVLNKQHAWLTKHYKELKNKCNKPEVDKRFINKKEVLHSQNQPSRDEPQQQSLNNDLSTKHQPIAHPITSTLALSAAYYYKKTKG